MEDMKADIFGLGPSKPSKIDIYVDYSLIMQRDYGCIWKKKLLRQR